MDLSKPPDDIELKNIIDKLAQFVARNGHEFEQMTKQKQRDNPKFSFLFGGTYFNYYQYRVTTEQAIIRQKQKMDMQMPGNMHPGYLQGGRQYGNLAPLNTVSNQGPMGPESNMNLNQHPSNVHYGGPPPPKIPHLAAAGQPPQSGLHLDSSQNVFNQQTLDLQEQIRESENNLAAQHQVLTKQQQIAIDEAIRKNQEEKIHQMAQEFGLNVNELESILQPIAETCTKDSISMGKGWIFSRCQTPMHYDIVMKYIHLQVTAPGKPFECKLHLLYLINDLLNHCYRKREDNLRRSIEDIIVPTYCYPFVGSDEEKQQRLIKLLRLWETHQYLDQSILDQLNKPRIALVNFQAALCNEFAALISPITSNTMAQYSQLQKQHQEFVAHQNSKIQQIQQQLSMYSDGKPPANLSHHSSTLPSQPQQPQHPQQPQTVPLIANQPFGHQGPPPQPQMPYQMPYSPLVMQRGVPLNTPSPGSLPLHMQQPSPSIQPTSVPNPQFFSNVPPVTAQPPPHPTPHTPHVPAPQPQAAPPPPAPPKDLPLEVPYYELPAGLMVPLVKLEDFEYKSLDPSKIRLPPPTPPSERLLKAVAAFYAPPSHDRPRNAEGWEQLGLYEFFRAKSQAKDRNEDKRHSSPSPENDESRRSSSSSSSYRRYPSSTSHKRNIREASPRRSYRRSRSRSSSSSSRDSGERYRRRSPSPRSRSRSPRYKYKSRSRSRSSSPPASSHKRLDESNKGAQMMKKMGWSGSGLGANNQGISDPVNPRDIRNKDDFKGIGSNADLNDPYEAFRKNKGQAFMHRVMRNKVDS